MVIKRAIMLFCGLLSLLLGVAGIILPVLPTVPFILLSAFCFARSSDRLYNWLHQHPWFADGLKQWQQNRAIRKSLKRRAYLVCAISFTISILLSPLLWVKVLLFCCAVGLGCFLYNMTEIEG